MSERLHQRGWRKAFTVAEMVDKWERCLSSPETGWVRGEEAVVAQECPEDVDSAVGEGVQGLDMAAAFGEDASQLRSGYAPENLASLRNLIIAILGAIGGPGITAVRDQIASRPYIRTLENLGIAIIEQTFQQVRLC